MLRVAVLLVCATGRYLAPLCTFHLRSGKWSVYNSEQWPRRRSTAIKFKVGEYHNTTCFKKPEPPGVYDSLETKLSIGKASKMYAVRGGPIELDKSDICYGWPETEPEFTRGPTLSEIKRENKLRRVVFGECDESRCSDGNGSLANGCSSNLPRSCLEEETYYTQSSDVPPYEGNGSNVQSFSGLGTLNHDILSERNGNEIVGPRQSTLTIKLKANSRTDCYLLFSAYSPLTGKSFPIDYIEFKQSTKEASYALNERLTASLYNMGEYDLQFINNHRTQPCDNDIVDRIKARSRFSVVRGTTKLLSLDHDICKDGDSASLPISFFPYWYDLHYSLSRFPNNDFEVIINLRLEYADEYSIPQIDNLEVYETVDNFAEGVCASRDKNREIIPASQAVWNPLKGHKRAVWTPLRGTILAERVSTKQDATVVTVELRVDMQYETRMPTFILIRNVSKNPEDIYFATVTLGDLRSERLEPRDELDIIDEKEAVESVRISRKNALSVHLSDMGNMIIVPLVLLKPRRTSRDLRSWDTDYFTSDHKNKCAKCQTFTTPAVPHPTNGSFWDCRSKCNIDYTGFVVSRSAIFHKSEIPRLWGGEPHHLFGYAIDLGLPPCAQNLTQLTELKVGVAYTKLLRGDTCRYRLMGTALLNVPEFTPSVYFKKINLYGFYKIFFHDVIRNGKSVSHYWFDPLRVVDTIGALPRSIAIGYHDMGFCADKIENIMVTYNLEYTPL